MQRIICHKPYHVGHSDPPCRVVLHDRVEHESPMITPKNPDKTILSESKNVSRVDPSAGGPKPIIRANTKMITVAAIAPPKMLATKNSTNPPMPRRMFLVFVRSSEAVSALALAPLESEKLD